MKIKSSSVRCSLLAVIAFAFAGCATLLSPVNQGIFNTAAETVTEQVLAKTPSDLAALQKMATALPTAFSGSITSAGIGSIIGQLGTSTGAASSSSLSIAAALDGAFRNYAQQNGSMNGGPMTLQGAIAQQVLAVFADGMQHAIQLYEGANNLPVTGTGK